jgi:carbon monoxide dehydrogenase subunit G
MRQESISVRGGRKILQVGGSTVPIRWRAKEDNAMATIRKDIVLDKPPGAVWDVVRDVGAVHRRFAPGFVVDTTLDAGARVVTFANGFVARELIVDVDDSARRLAYAAVGGRLTHHNASFQVFAEGADRTRLVWIADLLPNELAGTIEGMMDLGTAAIHRALDANANQ